MSGAAGTLEAVAVQLARLLQPLAGQLDTPAGARAFFAQMGFKLTEAQIAGIATPLSQAAGNAADLVRLAAAIVAAIEADNVAAAASKAIEAVQRIAQAIESLSTLGGNIGGLTGVPAADVAKRIFDFLVFQFLESTPEVNDLLDFLGLLDREEHDQESTDPANPPFVTVRYRFDQIPPWFSNPGGQARALYDWGPTFDGRKLFDRLEPLLGRAGLPVLIDDSGALPRLDAVFVEAVAKTDISPPGLQIRLRSGVSAVDQSITAGDATFRLKIDFALPANTGITIKPNGEVTAQPPAPGSTFRGDLLASVTAERKSPPAPFLLLGQAGGSRLEVALASLAAGVGLAWDGTRANGAFKFEGELRGLKSVIDTTRGDGFLGRILPGTRIEAESSVRLGVSTSSGFYFNGSGALEIRLPAHIQLGPVTLEGLTLGARLEGGNIPINVGVDLRAELGPLRAVVENVGATATFSFPPGNGGNLGPVDFAIGFKPPRGVGLMLDVGAVKGGGYLFFDPDRQEYGGVLELALAGIVTVKAIGLITTRLPDNQKGFSLILIITAEFGSGLQLGYGFTLLGVGGLIGLNRTMNLQALADGVRTGSINRIMFPQNPVENAPRIISDVRTIFPPYEGRFLIGPMAKLGWGTPTLISVSFGIVIEISGNIAVIGVLKVALPAENAPLIVIQAAFVGAIEFDKKRLWFFASLFDSRIVFLTLEGELGVLVAWGSDANFVLSVGGFHPRFRPPPLPFPAPRRIAISLLNTSIARIRTTTYFAVTSNTVQFGSCTELMFDVGVARVDGHLGFDALFQFSPFYFIVEVSGSVSLKVFGMGLFSISLEFALSGPTPYRARGTGTLSLFFFDVSSDFDITWGESEDTTLPPIAIIPLLEAEFAKKESWTVELPLHSNLLVSLRKLPAAEVTQVLHPLGSLRVSQRAVPLGHKIDKVGSQKPADGERFTLTPVAGLVAAGPAQEQFAKAQFVELSDSAKLTQRAFDPMESGLLLRAGAQALGATKLTKRRVRYEEIIIDTNYLRFQRRFRRLGLGFFDHLVLSSAITASDLSAHHKSQLDPFPHKVGLDEGGFAVARSDTNQPFSSETAHFASEAMAHQYLKEQVALRPELYDALHVIPRYEAAA